MSSLRPQEITRKAIEAGYLNPANTPAGDNPEDGSIQLCKTTVAVELGDWVAATAGADGHPSVHKPITDEEATWVGVVLHKAAANEWVRVKTAGIAYAKVTTTDLDPGDDLEVTPSSFSARKATQKSVCGRWLYVFGGDARLSVVHIGGGGGDLVVHHHTDAKNTMVRDVTDSTTLEAPLWHQWKVTDINFTGDPDPRLMLAIGGATSHGESPKEGWGWGGVIGAVGSLGFGQLGGSKVSGNQGVLGAETAKSSEGTNYRINVRGWAGFNARDRYALANPVVAPLRFTWCTGERAPTWFVPDGCDCLPGITPGTACDAATLWWSGTLKLDGTINPSALTQTNWTKQWTPQLAVERNCCEADYAAVTPGDYPCTIFSNVAAMEANAFNVSGAYENLIPWGYNKCAGRLDVLEAACYHSEQIIALWRTIMGGFSTVSQLLACMDANLVALGRPACCGTVSAATVPVVTGGPATKTCEASACD